uniref:EGF-like domain-containing protein n=1 Tax=Caenorhabditis tropicalis TaxID=1561998 RepID=A0A1I7URP4_9PELO
MAITVSELLNGVASRLIYEGSPCDSHPCWNEGKCVLNGSSNYFCECPPAFIGIQCEYRLFEICRSLRCRTSSSPICKTGNFLANCSFVNQQVDSKKNKTKTLEGKCFACEFVEVLNTNVLKDSLQGQK